MRKNEIIINTSSPAQQRGFLFVDILIDFTAISPYFGSREVVSPLCFLNHFPNPNLETDGGTVGMKEATTS